MDKKRSAIKSTDNPATVQLKRTRWALAHRSSRCAEKISIEDRLACLELTSYAFTEVPECTSQDTCFSEVQNAFPFNESVFSSKVQSEIFDSKNHLARAWLFLNKARNNLKIINNQCYLAKDFSQIPKEVNELNSNLVTIGKEVDEFNKSAVKAIHFETTSLENEDVNLIKEDPLFDDYILLNQNITDFSQKNLFNNTYASRFLFEAEKFNTIAQALDLQDTVRETTLFTLISANEKTIAEEAQKHDFPISFIEPFFTKTANFLKNLFSLTDSVSSLKLLPSFEFFSAVNGLISAKNSSASAFYEIFQNDSLHRKTLAEKNILEKQKISELLNSAEEKLSNFTTNYDKDFFPELFSENEYFTIETTAFPVSDFDDFQTAIKNKKESIESLLRELEEAEFLGKVSSGEKTQRLKQITDSAENLLEEISFAENLISNANETCDAKLSAIKTSISEEKFKSENSIIVSLKARINSEINSFEDTKETRFCSNAINDYSSLTKLVEQNFSEEEYFSVIENCIAETEKLVEFSGKNSFELQLSSLKNLPKPYSNPDLALNSCLELKQNFENDLLSDSLIKETETIFAELNENSLIMRSLLGNFSLPKSEKKTQDFLSEFTKISENFEGKKFKISSLATKDSVHSKTLELKAEAVKLLKELASEAVEAQYEIESTDAGLSRIFFRNPGSEVPYEFEATLNFDSKNLKKVFSTENIDFRTVGNKTMLKFSSLLSGLNSIIFDANSTQTLDENTNVPAQTASQKSLIEEKEKLLGEAKKLSGNKAEADFLGEKIDFFAQQGKFEKASEELAKLDDYVKNLKTNEQKEKENKSVSDSTEKVLQLKESVSKKILELKKNFDSLSEDQLEEIYAFSPITLERIQEIDSLLKKTPLADTESLELYMQDLQAAEEETTNAIEKLKENSLSSYNVAVSKRNSSETNPETDSFLLKSKNALEQKSYLESILNSKKASESITGNVVLSQNFEIPVAIYPLLLVILGIAFYVYKKAEEEKKPKPVLKIKKAEEN
ncbi:MAG TPA: hypothetical protein VFF13_03340 [archaeon]|nr:hypothetical protein [archaeon]